MGEETHTLVGFNRICVRSFYVALIAEFGNSVRNCVIQAAIQCTKFIDLKRCVPFHR